MIGPDVSTLRIVLRNGARYSIGGMTFQSFHVNSLRRMALNSSSRGSSGASASSYPYPVAIENFAF